MRRTEVVLGGIIVALFGFIGVQSMKQRRTVPPSSQSQSQSQSQTPNQTEPETPSPTDVRNLLELNRSRTYMDALLEQRDSTVRRWPLRTARPIRVWIDDPESTPGGKVGGSRFVRQAFDEWTMVGIPVRFEMVADSARADVVVVWREKLAEKRVGLTQVNGINDFYTRGTIFIATHRSTGEPLQPEHISSTVLHEVGHMLGLGHATDTASVMFPEMSNEIRSRRIHETDRVTLQLLYKLPVGRVR